MCERKNTNEIKLETNRVRYDDAHSLIHRDWFEQRAKRALHKVPLRHIAQLIADYSLLFPSLLVVPCVAYCELQIQVLFHYLLFPELIIDEKNGFIIPDITDPEASSEIIEKIICLPVLKRKKIAEHARHTMKVLDGWGNYGKCVNKNLMNNV